MAHPAVAEAAVIAVPDEKWDERPLAVVVLREGAAASPEELREFLAPVREVVAAGSRRVRHGDPEDRGRKVPQDGIAGDVRNAREPIGWAHPPFGQRLRANLDPEETMHQSISTLQDGYATVVTIDNPPLNALSASLLEGLEATIDRLDGDAGTRAIVLRGGGERAFVAGADIKEFPAMRVATSPDAGSARGLQKLGHRMDAADTPFVAAIQGFCLGGGLELAMCCDVRVCSDDAQLGQPEVKLGLIPGGGGTSACPGSSARGVPSCSTSAESSSTRRLRTGGVSSRGSCRATSCWTQPRASRQRSRRARRMPSPSSASWPARRAICHSKKGCDGRRRRFAGAWQARMARRESPHSSRSASRTSGARDREVSKARGPRTPRLLELTETQ